MKCVIDRRDLQTYRTTDSEAAKRVQSGRYTYGNKQTWKLQGRAA